MIFICNNITCEIPVQALYFSGSYQVCCCHCSLTDLLQILKEAYSICHCYCMSKYLKPLLQRKTPKINQSLAHSMEKIKCFFTHPKPGGINKKSKTFKIFLYSLKTWLTQ